MELAGLSCAVSFAKVCLPLASLYMFICFETIWKHNCASSYVWQRLLCFHYVCPDVPDERGLVRSGGSLLHTCSGGDIMWLLAVLSLYVLFYINISHFYLLYVIVKSIGYRVCCCSVCPVTFFSAVELELDQREILHFVHPWLECVASHFGSDIIWSPNSRPKKGEGVTF